DRVGELFVNDGLRRAQHGVVVTICVDGALGGLLGLHEQRTHQLARVVYEANQLLTIAFDVLDGAQGNAGVGGRLRDGGRDLYDKPRVERLGNDVFGPEGQVLAIVRAGHLIVLFGLRQFGNGFHAGELHFLGDAGRACVQGATENEGKAQDVVDLVGVVRPAGGDDAVGARGARDLGTDLGFGVGQGQDQGAVGHGLDHVGRQHAGGRAAQEHVGALHHVGQRARLGLLRVPLLVGFHVGVAAFPDHAARVDHVDVLALDAQVHQQVQAGDRRGARARHGELDLGDVLAHDVPAVQDGCRRDDGGAVLVVMEHRNLHAIAQLLFNVEAFGRLDVFQVDAAQRGFQRRDDVDELVRVGFGEFDVEHVDARELLEEAAFAFHDRLGGQRADVAQAEHGSAVRDDAHQVGARGVLGCGLVALVENRHAGGGYAWRIG